MAFIAKSDLKLSILLDELNEITRGDDTIVTAAINSAQGEMRTYLYDSYDVDTIFSQTGDSRNQLLVNLMADMAVYLLTASGQPGQDLEDRRARYKRAITWLNEAKDTKTYSDLPRRETTQQTHFVSGSNPKRTNHY